MSPPDPASREILPRLDGVLATWRRVAASTRRGFSILSEETGRFEFYSHSELLAHAAAASNAFSRRGIRPGDRVLITATTTPAFVQRFFGLLLLGAVPAPVPPRTVLTKVFASRVGPLLEHHDFFVCEDFEDADIIRARHDGREVTVIRFADMASEIDLNVGRRVLGELLKSDGVAVAASLDDDVLIQYTSGSTGQPRGVAITWRNLLANVDAMAKAMDLVPAETVLASWLPLHHDMGLVAVMLSGMLNVLSVVMVPTASFAKRPAAFLRLIEETKATHTLMPAFAIEWICRAVAPGEEANHRLDSLRFVCVGAEPINARMLHLFNSRFAVSGLRQTAISPGYGLAEATVAVSCSTPSDRLATVMHDAHEVVCSGRPLEGFEVQIDPIEGLVGVGAIKVRGESVARFALVDGRKVLQVDSEGFYDTKDIGFFHDGELVILGRADDAFIQHGANYFPSDLEMVVRRLPGFERRRVVCFASSESNRVPRVVIAYETKPLPDLEMQNHADRIRTSVLTELGVRVDDVLAVPLRTISVTTSGKVRRRELAALFVAGHLSQRREVAPVCVRRIQEGD